MIMKPHCNLKRWVQQMEVWSQEITLQEYRLNFIGNTNKKKLKMSRR
jgi:hypothetical protein